MQASSAQTLNAIASKANLEDAQNRFQQSVGTIDQKLGDLQAARDDIAINQRLREFQQIAQPAAIAINNYLKDTTREFGIQTLLDPSRHDEHVQQVAQATIDIRTARPPNSNNSKIR